MKKLFALVLVLVMIVGVLPTFAFADGAKTECPFGHETEPCPLGRPDCKMHHCVACGTHINIEIEKKDKEEIEAGLKDFGDKTLDFIKGVGDFIKDIADKLPECPSGCPGCGKPECPGCTNPECPGYTEPNKSPSTGMEMGNVAFASVMMVSAACVAAYVVLSKREEV